MEARGLRRKGADRPPPSSLVSLSLPRQDTPGLLNRPTAAGGGGGGLSGPNHSERPSRSARLLIRISQAEEVADPPRVFRDRPGCEARRIAAGAPCGATCAGLGWRSAIAGSGSPSGSLAGP